MNTASRTLTLIVLHCTVSGWALAQAAAAPGGATSTPAKATAQSEAGEPRAGTSSPERAAAVPPAPAAAAAPTGHQAAARAAPGAARAPKGGAKIDRLDLGTATVTGSQEQPKVMYIVPWKRSDIGDLAGKPMNSLVDEILAPVDRDVFKREVVYYHAVRADASQNAAPPKPAQQGEK